MSHSLDYIRQVTLHERCDAIERDIAKQKRPPGYVPIARRVFRPNPIAKANRWSPGICLICGEHFSLVTNYHAGTHGYESANALIADGKVKFIRKYIGGE